ncbi:MAG: oligosaccharide flippase family protein [Terriglobales bacterium]
MLSLRLPSGFQTRLDAFAPPGSMRARFLNGAAWSTIGLLASQGLNFVAWMIVARFLTAGQFGELGMIQATLGMCGILAGTNLGMTATKHVAEFRTSSPERAGRLIGSTMTIAAALSAIVALALVVAAPALGADVLRAPNLVVELQLSAVFLIFTTVNSAQVGALEGLECFKETATVTFVRGLLSIVFLAGGTLLLGLRGSVLGLTLAAAGAAVTSHIGISRKARVLQIPLTYLPRASELAIYWRFSLPAFLSALCVVPTLWALRMLLVREPSGYQQLGFFAAATRLQDLISMIGNSLGAALIPMLASSSSLTRSRIADRNVVLTWAFALAVCIPLMAFPECLALAFGSQYASRSAQLTLVLTLCSACVVTFKQGLARLFVVNDFMWVGAASNLLWSLIALGAAHYLVGWGAVGIAGAVLIAYVGNTAVTFPVYIRRSLANPALFASARSALIWLAVAAVPVAAIWVTSIPLRLALTILVATVAIVALGGFIRPAASMKG